ncbi:hypothetical protein JZ751_021577 [Albula glossodonta]|uniref:Uncharacterized protein n=1 Tax=Albula glossodonta TaxID=121402 RepID=A0A8T2NK98_9TELE|nr:hypothetical protein JZ751_021577 [Albula glossodonta]
MSHFAIFTCLHGSTQPGDPQPPDGQVPRGWHKAGAWRHTLQEEEGTTQSVGERGRGQCGGMSCRWFGRECDSDPTLSAGPDRHRGSRQHSSSTSATSSNPHLLLL